ncbi:MAG: TonB family protein, partial [Gammaproteobacteria bacterium]|nr:TonB family protein [Gammaproteobacteria bacterium]
MSAVAAAAPVITPVDRLGLTVCLAVIAHAVVILGVTFAPEESIQPRYDTMEIVLVTQKSAIAPEDARLLAQASLEGGGEQPEKVTPATPLPPPFPDVEAQVAAPPPGEVQPGAPPRTEAEPATSAAEQLLAADALDAEHDRSKTLKRKPEPQREKSESEKTERPLPEQRPSATALLTNSFKIAALSAEIKRKLEAQTQRPKRKFISASTREYKYAAYMEAWRAKVERVGNLNYPDEARKRRLSGSLILDVALNPDGSVNQITIRRSSGYRFLDDAAIG